MPEDKSNVGEVTNVESELTLIAWGILLGFGYLTGWKAYKQTRSIPQEKRYKSRYVLWIWLDLISIMCFGCLGWLANQRHIQPQLFIYITLVILWAIQAQAVLQININRINLIAVDKRLITRLRIGCFTVISVFIVGTASIWIPGQLGISEKLTQISRMYIKIEGSLIIVIDVSLSFYFIRVVKQQLIEPGLDKYKSLVAHNFVLVWTTMGIELVALGLMYYPTSPLIWLQFGPLAWIAKLNVELSMANLIMKLAFEKPTFGEIGDSSFTDSERTSNIQVPDSSAPINSPTNSSLGIGPGGNWMVTRTQEIALDVEYIGESTCAGMALGPIRPVRSADSDERPLREEREWERVGYHGSISYKAEVSTT